ncbi:MAG: magnesium transporter [Candidatus Melainabacteria bacterium HGW-Melainabacteria-1]|nr:MAG: magnesium transporter [Candidatus Melainabacteria bacterium HGW-Melainabacteria-1]
MSTGKLQLDYLPGHLELLLEHEDHKAIESLLRQFRPEDVAECLLKLSAADIREILLHIDAELAGELVEHIDDDFWRELLAPMDQRRLIEILDYLPSDDAADLLEEFDTELREELLALMRANTQQKESYASLEALLQYPEHTAGAIMNPDIVLVRQDLEVDQALNMIRANIESFKDINYIFITDPNKRLTGMLPLPLLISAKAEALIEEVMLKDIIAVNALMDEDDVVDVVRKYELTTVPVVDSQGLLVGIITIDDILDVIEEQADEDAYKMAALGDPDSQTSAFKAALTRIPWLLICLGGSMSAGTIIHLFEQTLAEAIVLAAFMPAVMGMAGNTGVQTSTLLIRSMGTGPSLRRHLLRIVLREFRTALAIGLLCGSLAGSVAWYFFHANPAIGGVIGLSLCLSILFSTFLGTSIPFLFQKLSVDPAVASGPFITTINDSTALIIYLSIATFTLSYIQH